MLLKSHKTVRIKVFLTIFAWWLKDSEPDLDPDPSLWLPDPDADPGGSKLTDPDQQHRLQ